MAGNTRRWSLHRGGTISKLIKISKIGGETTYRHFADLMECLIFLPSNNLQGTWVVIRSTGRTLLFRLLAYNCHIFLFQNFTQQHASLIKPCYEAGVDLQSGLQRLLSEVLFGFINLPTKLNWEKEKGLHVCLISPRMTRLLW